MRTALSLFAGAGGFDLGARMAGLNVVASIEREALPAQALALNGFHPVQADATAVDYSQWRGVDVVFGGPPCQGHSIANNRGRRADDPRNTLAWEVRAARETEARHVLIENVATFDRQLLAELLRELAALGYWVSTQNLNAADYGVPQTRRRRFIWATRDLLPAWPEPTHSKRRRASMDAALSGLTFRPADLPPWLLEKGVDPRWRLIDAQNKNKFGPQGRPGHLPAPTMTSGSYYHRVRLADGSYGMLDPHGMARLQSFPDEHRFVGNKGQRALQIGNAVPPLLAYALLRGVA